MSRKRMALLVAAFAACAFMGTDCRAQSGGDVNRRLSTLEKQVATLLSENAGLRAKVDELETSRDEGSGGMQDDSELNQAIREVMSSGEFGYISNPRGVSAVTIDGETRTRLDFRSNTGDLRDDIDDDGLRLDFRFNLGFKFVLDKKQNVDLPAKVTTYFEIQAAGRGSNNTAEDIAAGIAGAGSGAFEARSNELDQIRLYQAWIQLEDILGTEGLSLKFGRQELAYGSQLLLGSNSFFTGTVHDAVRMDFYLESLSANISFFYAKEAASDGQVTPGLAVGGLFTGRFRASGDEDEMLGIYTEFAPEGLDPIQIDAYWIYFNARSAGASVAPDNVTTSADPGIDSFGRAVIGGRTHTVGLWVRGEDVFTDGLFLSVESAYQFGKDEADQDLSAFLVEAAIEYRPSFLESVNGAFYAGYYFAEGPDGNESQGFTTLFNSRHDNVPIRGHGSYSRFGNIDFIPSQNVHVFQIGFKFEPDPDWVVGITYLYAALDEGKVPLTFVPNGALYADDRGLGHEIDLYARYQMTQQTVFFFNVSVFIPTFDFFEEDPFAAGAALGFKKVNSDLAVGVFAQIRVTF